MQLYESVSAKQSSVNILWSWSKGENVDKDNVVETTKEKKQQQRNEFQPSNGERTWFNDNNDDDDST